MNKFEFKKIDQMTGREMFCVERLRTDTFVTEQKITLPELDDEDLIATQVFLLNQEATNAVAACRVFKQNGQWTFGRVAVAGEYRHQGLGRQMMEEVHEFLKDQGATSVTCHAQMQAKPFYESLGYEVAGPEFDEGGVSHIQMTKRLL
ncbi:GNAT family acetyltransferase [Lactobacillus pasteurii DSM 23907 = CRBIP 24.76]|uniref:GNAT family acetyltransferase n=1 Tax=Lactobacillus pasteurii DSM 23907 = CRBIP 24.76 TaxID=1423790 RepID=I7KK99_9LACO|nr:GNAT family N-acetyltransferase [Lactobacillus pasteurii]KRK07948.1 GNAT family acetyltransferase [Lactobacillus pasteurii DSM 23907 = CRBIP 24.76]TDG77887.1 hypothetical protein C5L33_001692 [Lactobacillus pasteurii]CCI84284.1 GNAT family acetyltransferase [Lactobacillus pasteurii DSM 23907 = CRBIP 24.76]